MYSKYYLELGTYPSKAAGFMVPQRHDAPKSSKVPRCQELDIYCGPSDPTNDLPAFS